MQKLMYLVQTECHNPLRWRKYLIRPTTPEVAYQMVKTKHSLRLNPD